jgi:hypothetical protein
MLLYLEVEIENQPQNTRIDEHATSPIHISTTVSSHKRFRGEDVEL